MPKLDPREAFYDEVFMQDMQNDAELQALLVKEAYGTVEEEDEDSAEEEIDEEEEEEEEDLQPFEIDPSIISEEEA
jgi:hypothetical protein